MSEIRDFFIKSLDETDHGINKMMCRMLVQLKNSDLDVWLKFQQLELKPQFYSFRSVSTNLGMYKIKKIFSDGLRYYYRRSSLYLMYLGYGIRYSRMRIDSIF